ncbi:MAG: hypothetical protein K9J81_01060 [Desulfohalobiaceae bacterium]|nr:hypothetical protein [Desulfohalobiaceae bacterium]
MILDLEESWANLVYCRQGRPLYFRSFSLFSPGPPEAEPAHEKTESDHEPPEDSISPHSTANAQPGTALVKDIELTLLAAGTPAQGASLSNLLLLGEKTLEQQEIKTLESAFQAPVLTINDCIPSQCYAREDLSASAAHYTTALALALQCKTKNSGLNFRQGLYAKQTAYTKWKRPLLYAGAACCVLFISWMATLGFHIVLLEKKNAHIENKVHTVFYRTLPEIHGKYLPSQYASIIQSKIDALQNRSALYSSQVDQLKLLDALKIFHSFIPDEAKVSFEYLVLDSKRIMINGIANSFNTIEDLKNTLLRANEFNAVNIKGAKSSNQGQSINFSLEIETNV